MLLTNSAKAKLENLADWLAGGDGVSHHADEIREIIAECMAVEPTGYRVLLKGRHFNATNITIFDYLPGWFCSVDDAETEIDIYRDERDFPPDLDDFQIIPFYTP